MPKQIIRDTIKNRKKKEKKDPNAVRIALYTAAANGTFNKLDPKLLTPENLGVQDSFGLNALHSAAAHGQLHEVPKELLLDDLLLTWDHNGKTALHYAAEHDQMKWLPKHLVTEENLLAPDAENNSVYHYLANYGTLNSIPQHLITQEAILIENDFKKNVLDMALNSEAKESNPELDQSSLLLKILNKKSLEKLIRENPRDKVRIKACKTELSKRAVMDKIKTQAVEEAFEI